MKDPIRVTTATRRWNQVRRIASRNEWVIWLLGLPRSVGKPAEPGLILIQIDGLSKHQMERAVANGRMPFLKSLIERERYQCHTLYSGLPASTPSVQAELYYGERTAVPAFGFRDHRTGRLVRMFANEIAGDVETRLKQKDQGLLTDGSSYCNVYGGGADEVHFCATSFGWSEFFSAVNPFKLIVVMVLNFWLFFRVLGLMMVELFLATVDFVRGIFSGRRFWQELIMIPARVVVVILLRELVTVGACYDSARGLPIIHLNFLGYDEQAHRRGPSSNFAHLTLSGIDESIRRIWKSAHLGAGREYDVWVFSDHGQEATTPYQIQEGELIQEVVARMVDGCCPPSPSKKPAKYDRLPSRADWLGIGWLVSMLFGEQDQDIQSRSQNVQTVTSGPLAFVYLLAPEVKDKSDEFASRLVGEFNVPLAVQARPNRQAKVTTSEGTFTLPGDAVQVFGADHPFLEDVNEDLIRLVHHVDAGDIVLIGWTHESQSTSFVLQNGAHAGPGIEETRAFALLPSDVPVSDSKPYLRPNDLRLASLRLLNRKPGPLSRVLSRSPQEDRIRIVTYNVHACVGMDGELSPDRIARVIAQSGANVICLQELDVFRHRSGNQDQAHAIAKYLEMNYEFHPAWHLEEEKFGNAILTKYPMRVIEKKAIHHHKQDRSRRSALWAEIDINKEMSIQIINTHLSIYPKEQLIQAQELMEEWVQPASLLGPVVLCGDFNARPSSATCKRFSKGLFNVESFDKNPVKSTLFSPYPLMRVDHIYVTNELAAKHVKVLDSRIAKVASDHLPLLAELTLKTDAKTFDQNAIKR